MDRAGITTISFDCYGTLINWEAGLLPALRSMLSSHRVSLADADILELYGEFEAEAETGAYQSYRKVLESVVRAFGERFTFDPNPDELRSLHESLPSWPPFSDTVAALRKLKERFRLAVISNIDNDLFAATSRQLEVEFDGVITAEMARSYKPSVNNFQLALRTLGIAPVQLLHAGQSVYHDVVPARGFGIRTVWVNRRSARPGVGAVRRADATPDLEVQDLAGLVAALNV